MTKPAQRRGAALVLVLGALVVAMTAAVAAARVSIDTHVQRTLDVSESVADDAMRGASARIEEWLRSSSADAVAPVDAGEPRIAVMHARIAAGQSSVTIEVTAFDQHGMVPWASARAGDAFARAALPEDARDSVANVSVPKGTPPGIDLAAPSSVRSHWPAHAPMELREFGATQGERSSPRVVESAHSEPAIAALVASHLEGAPSINVNTAPMALIEAAERIAQRSLADAVRTARTAGKRAPLPPPPAGAHDAAQVRFVGSSDCWSFRVDIFCGPVRRSWWITYRQSRDGWQCVQRLRIDP